MLSPLVFVVLLTSSLLMQSSTTAFTLIPSMHRPNKCITAVSTKRQVTSLRFAADDTETTQLMSVVPQLPPVDDLSINNNNNNDDNDDNSKIIGRVMLLGIAALWGTNFPVVKYLETLCFHPPCNHPPSEATFARFGTASAVAIPILLKQFSDIRGKKGVDEITKNVMASQYFDTIKSGLECGVYISLGYFAQALALETIPSTEAAFLCSLTVVVVPFLSIIFLKKSIQPVNLISAVLAVGGVGVLEGLIDVKSIFDGFLMENANAVGSALSLPESLSSSTEQLSRAAAAPELFFGLQKGDWIALGQPLGFGMSFIRIEQAMNKFKDDEGGALTLAMGQCVSVGALSLLWLMSDFNFHFPNMAYMLDIHRVGAVLWTSLVTTVLAVWLQGIALKSVSAIEAALTFSTEPGERIGTRRSEAKLPYSGGGER